MPIVADSYRYVVGVDTHAATHAYAIIDTSHGGLVDQQQFPTTRAGLARAAAWIKRRTDQAQPDTAPSMVLVSAEGTGSYGAQLSVLLTDHGYRVVDAPAPQRVRGSSKTDQVDAVTAARSTLAKQVDALADTRSSQTRAVLQILLTARNSMTTDRTRVINALTALLRTHPLGVDARRKPGQRIIKAITKWQTRAEPITLHTARAEAVRLATRITDLDTDIATNTTNLRQIVADTRPDLLDLCGVGPVNAATVLTTWSHPGRIRSKSAFAKIGGVCPIEVSSGRRHEHRLNRGGDRQLNKALHSIAKTRMRYDQRTRDYVDRRTLQGQSKPRTRRCLKRYIANELFRILNTPTDA